MRSEIPEGETLSREYLANERTLLSWIRTGINAISVGILLDTAVRALNVLYGDSFGGVPVLGNRQNAFAAFGIAMVVFGAIVEIAAVVRFVQFTSAIRRGRFTTSSLVYLLLVFGLLILGVAYIVYTLVV